MPNPKRFFLATAFISLTIGALWAAGAQSADSASRGRYLAGQGVIIPEEEVYPDSLIASVDYDYPEPSTPLGVYLYPGSRQMPRAGQEGILHIGLQGRDAPYAELPPMNLAFVVDLSASMAEADKIAWIKEGLRLFAAKARPADYISLVVYNDGARVAFPSGRIDTEDRRRRFLEAVDALTPQGGSQMEAGLTVGYEQVLSNFRETYINRVLLLSDGTEFSARLGQAGAQSGDVRISLLWDNRNDLDLIVYPPTGGKIYYGSRRNGFGLLDVDMNVNGETPKPVENVFWPAGKAPAGKYRVCVRYFGWKEKAASDRPSRYNVEIKNGAEYLSYSGVIESGEIEIGSFEYKPARQEKALVFQLAAGYREMGVLTTTIGVGQNFDIELMRQLAIEGGGSSRFIGGPEDMRDIFDTGFARMAVPVARDLRMRLDFLADVEILGTWGYANQIEGNTIYYSLSTLHLGDYETILVKYRLKPVAVAGPLPLAAFRVGGVDVLGRVLEHTTATLELNITDDAQPLDGISDGMVLKSGSLLRYADALKRIARAYYGAQAAAVALDQIRATAVGQPTPTDQAKLDDLAVRALGLLDEAYKTSAEMLAELENAALRLDEADAFAAEREVLTKYLGILRKDVAGQGGKPDTVQAPPAVRSADPTVLNRKLANLFNELVLNSPAGERPVVAVAGFASRKPGADALLALIDEVALVHLSASGRMVLVDRANLDKVLDEQALQLSGLVDTDAAVRVGQLLAARYIVTGQVQVLPTQAVVFSRMIDVASGEILSAAQVMLARSDVAAYLSE
jgi:Ca-activated chloride channel family protein